MMSDTGVPLPTFRQILGHRDLPTAMRYINPNDENRWQAVRAFIALLEDSGKSQRYRKRGHQSGKVPKR